MRIGILGAGGMAGALGAQWVRAGHEVLVSGRDPGRTRAAAARIGARPGTWAEAAAFGGATLLAVPHDAVPYVLDAAGAADGALRGRPLIDCVNAVLPGFRLDRPDRRSFADGVAARAPGASVVKAFNLCHVDVWRMTPPSFDDGPLMVPLCGDDPAALGVVRGLVRDLGCTPGDGGGLDRAGQMEETAAFAIGLWKGGADARAMLPPRAYASGTH